MLVLIISVVALAVGAGLVISSCRRMPQWARAEMAKTIRDLRLRAGGYSLKLLMRRMIDDMLDSVLPSITKSYLPNDMRFGLHPRDARRWGTYFPELARELRALMLAEIASRPALYVQGELQIAIFEDGGASPGRPSFQARMIPSSAATRCEPASCHDGATAAAPNGIATVLVAPSMHWSWSITIDGRRPAVLLGEMTLGRGPTSDIRIEHDAVSRAHARLTVVDDGVTIVDLDSSNGTSVNGHRVETAMLEPGDVISFGGQINATISRSAAVTRTSAATEPVAV